MVDMRDHTETRRSLLVRLLDHADMLVIPALVLVGLLAWVITRG